MNATDTGNTTLCACASGFDSGSAAIGFVASMGVIMMVGLCVMLIVELDPCVALRRHRLRARNQQRTRAIRRHVAAFSDNLTARTALEARRTSLAAAWVARNAERIVSFVLACDYTLIDELPREHTVDIDDINNKDANSTVHPVVRRWLVDVLRAESIAVCSLGYTVEEGVLPFQITFLEPQDKSEEAPASASSDKFSDSAYSSA